MLFNEFAFWIFFSIIVAILFLIDLYVTDHRRGQITLKASLLWSAVWIITALLFNVFIYFYLEEGHARALEFITGYLIEKSLSVDNLFVFLMIFSVMGVKKADQPHILKWGIISAIIFRIVFIIAGVSLIKLFHPIIYLFGLILFYAAYKMAFGKEEAIDLDSNLVVKVLRKYFKLHPTYSGRHFFIRENGRLYMTSMFLTLMLIESSDIVFAIDSIPAIIAITKDTFIIISSNIFAILGLRALYFALSGVVDLFMYLKYGVALILFYVGIKMVIADIYAIPTIISLGIIIFTLAFSVILSLLQRKRLDEKARRMDNESSSKTY